MNTQALPIRQPDHAIAPQFLNRWSPRAFSAQTLSEAEMHLLFEAARWAPSASNNQPWRFAYGLRDDAGFEKIAASLVPFNRAWAEKAAGLIVVASATSVQRQGVAHPNPWHAFDAGTAWGFLSLQAQEMGLITHAMGGFDAQALAASLALPEGHVIHAVVAVGYRGSVESLPEMLQARETPNTRHPITALAGRGGFV